MFPIPPVHHQLLYNGQFWFGYGEFFAPNPPAGAVVTYILPSAAPEGVPIIITDAAGKTIRTLRGPAQAGLNRACWDLREAPPIADPNPRRSIADMHRRDADRAFAIRQRPRDSAVGTSTQRGRRRRRRGGRGVGPVVLPGRYTVAVGSLKQDVTVEPDPHFSHFGSGSQEAPCGDPERLLASAAVGSCARRGADAERAVGGAAAIFQCRRRRRRPLRRSTK